MLAHPVKGHLPPAMSETFLLDAGLQPLLDKYFGDPRPYLTRDARAIAERNRVLMELARRPEPLAAMRALRDAIADLPETAREMDGDGARALSAMTFLPRLYEAARGLLAALPDESGCAAEAEMAALRLELTRALGDCFPPNFAEDWERYASGLGFMGSITYKIRFDAHSRVSSAAIERVRARGERDDAKPVGLKSRLLGEGKTFALPSVAAARAHSHDMNEPERLSLSFAMLLRAQGGALRPLMRSRALRLYERFAALYDELDFFVRAEALLAEAERGEYAFTFAEIAPGIDSAVSVEGMFHPALTEMAERVTRNDLRAPRGRQVCLLGGYNRDGKTTYLRAVGAVQALFQMGLPCPARSARLYPLSSLVSAFACEEDTGFTYGKLGQELKNARAALSLLTEDGMFIFNEPITGTSAEENYLISREMLLTLLAIGCRGVWVTHLYRLFDDAQAIGRLGLSGEMRCLRSRQGDDDAPPFSIVEGIPARDSGARLV